MDHAFNEFHNHKWGSFGFIEFEDDQEILEALLTAAGDWVAERGMERMIGPIDFHMNNEAGLLVEGYDVPRSSCSPGTRRTTWLASSRPGSPRRWIS